MDETPFLPGALVGFNEFIREKGLDPDTYVIGFAIREPQAGCPGLAMLTPEAEALVLEFIARKSWRSRLN